MHKRPGTYRSCSRPHLIIGRSSSWSRAIRSRLGPLEVGDPCASITLSAISEPDPQILLPCVTSRNRGFYIVPSARGDSSAWHPRQGSEAGHARRGTGGRDHVPAPAFQPRRSFFCLGVPIARVHSLWIGPWLRGHLCCRGALATLSRQSPSSACAPTHMAQYGLSLSI